MKKIFLIIASCITIVIIGLLVATNFIFVHEKVVSKTPNTINIYKNSIASLNNKSYTNKDAEFNSLVDLVNELGKVSIFERLTSGCGLDEKIEQSPKDQYSSTIADIRNTNICVEFIYEAKQDKIVYLNGYSKVISYNKITFVLSKDKVGTILVYYAEGNAGYDNYDPLVMHGKSEKLINFIGKM